MKTVLRKRLLLVVVVVMSIISFIITSYAAESTYVSNSNYTLFGVGQCSGAYNDLYHTWVYSHTTVPVATLYYAESTYRNFTKISGHSKTNYNASYCYDDIYTPVDSSSWAYYEVYTYHSSTDSIKGNLVTTCSDSEWD